ncbi:hypothetical protein IV203_028109 [Nitzschia inconspicua]|uniref:Uncharacterized protein n=1 Tax=Nitzschia inconspicua TaxID=303405 RepID=A0A9K3Q412_9STRA|nr:hypothetical protein IV203_028109 [Nitzschia inconspicua]
MDFYMRNLILSTSRRRVPHLVSDNARIRTNTTTCAAALDKALEISETSNSSSSSVSSRWDDQEDLVAAAPLTQPMRRRPALYRSETTTGNYYPIMPLSPPNERTVSTVILPAQLMQLPYDPAHEELSDGTNPDRQRRASSSEL